MRASGIARYEIWTRVGDGPAQRLATTPSTTALVPAQPGVRNQYFTIAVDRQGNREPRPSRADSGTRVRAI